MTDAQCAGRIVTDVTELRDEALLEIVPPRPDHEGVIRTQPLYRVEYDLVAIVEGRNLRYEARWWPRDNDSANKKRKFQGEAGYRVLETAQVSIASAFRPGTK